MSGLFDGLQKIVNVIQTIVQGIKMGIEFLVNLCKMTTELLKLIITTIGNMTTLIATLPPWITAIATATLGISVIYVILGRETGK